MTCPITIVIESDRIPIKQILIFNEYDVINLFKPRMDNIRNKYTWLAIYQRSS